MYEILYCKRKDIFNYNKIVAIKPVGWAWSPGEKQTSVFGIVTLDLTDDQIKDYNKYNKYCISNTEDGIIETDEKYRIKIDTNILSIEDIKNGATIDLSSRPIPEKPEGI